MTIIIEQKEIKLDKKIITELENFHKNSESIYNNSKESLKSAFNIISLKDNDDFLKVIKLFNKLDIKLTSDMDKLLKSLKSKPVDNDFLIKETNGWRTQSHYIGYGMNSSDLEKCIDYILSNNKTSNKKNKKDYTKDKIKSRIKELKDGKNLYDKNENLVSAFKASYTKDAHKFWKNSVLLIEELEKFI